MEKWSILNNGYFPLSPISPFLLNIFFRLYEVLYVFFGKSCKKQKAYRPQIPAEKAD